MFKTTVNYLNISPQAYGISKIPRSGEVSLIFFYQKSPPQFMSEIIYKILIAMKNSLDIRMKGNDSQQTVHFYIPGNMSALVLIKRFKELVIQNKLLNIFSLDSMENVLNLSAPTDKDVPSGVEIKKEGKEKISAPSGANKFGIFSPLNAQDSALMMELTKKHPLYMEDNYFRNISPC
jgi:hypothetical protein